jgi:hypothetical protein
MGELKSNEQDPEKYRKSQHENVNGRDMDRPTSIVRGWVGLYFQVGAAFNHFDKNASRMCWRSRFGEDWVAVA